jgi:hypothetical protein
MNSRFVVYRHEFGERFISSAVANPVGLYKALTKSAHVDNNQVI